MGANVLKKKHIFQGPVTFNGLVDLGPNSGFDLGDVVQEFSVATPAAAGSGQSTFTALTKQLNAVSAADGTKGVALPAAAAGKPIHIINQSATSILPVAPVNGGNDAINSLTAGTGVFNLGPGQSAWFVPTSATQWYVTGHAAVVGTPTEQDLDGRTASVAELNYLDLATLGTGAASKAVVLDAGEDYIWPPTGVLTYGGTAITATGAELNLLDGAASTVTVALAASLTTDGMDITVTAKDAAGATLAGVHEFVMNASDAATGIGLTADAFSGDLTATAGAILGALTAKKAWVIQTAANGIWTGTLVDSANPADVYIAVKRPPPIPGMVVSAISGTNWEGV